MANRWWTLAIVPLVLICASEAAGQTRTYAGSMSSAWRTIGQHGHDQPPCAERRISPLEVGWLDAYPNCNPVDFARGNLDNSIGFRAGRERDWLRSGAFSFVGGIEGSLNYTEYNLSQSDFIFATANAFAGVDYRMGSVSLGGRIGAGPFATTDGAEYGFQHVEGVHITLPLHPGAAIRVSHQSMSVFRSSKTLDLYGAGPAVLSTSTTLLRHPRARETAILIVTSPEYLGASSWEYSASTGSTFPGGPIGGSRMLRPSSYSEISAFRSLPWYGLDARVTWIASAHESSRPTTFLGYDGNYRSKTIQGLGLGVSRSTGRVPEQFSMRYGAGVEVADWRDEHQLLTRDNQPLTGGVETAIVLDGAFRWHVGRNVALETSFTKAYWPGIDLGEIRVGFGLVVTR
jgi:hypothetical protein